MSCLCAKTHVVYLVSMALKFDKTNLEDLGEKSISVVVVVF